MTNTTLEFLATSEHPCTAFDGAYCGDPETKRFMNGWFCFWHTPVSKGGTVTELPGWLAQRLGTPTRGRGVKATSCIVCHRPILVGMSEDVAAHRALVDPMALSPTGEALALIDGRCTYQLGKYDQGLALWQRDSSQIAGKSASAECIVLTDHKCGGPQFPAIEIPLTARKESVPNDPPF